MSDLHAYPDGSKVVAESPHFTLLASGRVLMEEPVERARLAAVMGMRPRLGDGPERADLAIRLAHWLNQGTNVAPWNPHKRGEAATAIGAALLDVADQMAEADTAEGIEIAAADAVHALRSAMGSLTNSVKDRDSDIFDVIERGMGARVTCIDTARYLFSNLGRDPSFEEMAGEYKRRGYSKGKDWRGKLKDELISSGMGAIAQS